MPKWYSFYELNIFMRILRVILGMWLVFSRNIIPYSFDILFDIDIEDMLFFPILNLSILIFFSFSFILKFILRFIFIKQLIKNSPFSLKNCLFVGLKQICGSIIITGGLGLGTNIVDNTLERHGYIPP